MRSAQRRWGSLSCYDRAAAIRRLPDILSRRCEAMHRGLAIHPDRTLADTISSEILPLAAAAQWNRIYASGVLRERRLSRRGGNLFLGRLRVRTVREPLGCVLIIAPWNYPIFLTGVPLLQALISGNAAAVKPAPGCEAVTAMLLEAFIEAGVPEELIISLSSDVSEVDDAFGRGIDCVVLTASSDTGRAVARKAADRLVPVIAELSGCDAMVVLPGADLDRVAAAVAFAMRLNGGSTCMAPRRLIADAQTLEQLEPKLREVVATLPPLHCRRAVATNVSEVVREAVAEGANVVCGHGEPSAEPETGPASGDPLTVVSVRPVILRNVRPSMRIAQEDLFAPIVAMIDPFMGLDNRGGSREAGHVANDDNDAISEYFEALRAAVDDCRYALSASIFGPEPLAVRLAERIDAGVVTVNDLIAPTVEPSISFGGRGESGYGATRGAEGLRQLTREKSIVCRRGSFLPHLRPIDSSSDVMLDGLLSWQHARRWRDRLAGLRKMLQAAKRTGSDRPRGE